MQIRYKTDSLDAAATWFFLVSSRARQTRRFPDFHPPSPPSSSPGGVGDVDSSQVDAIAAHDEQRREAEQRHSAADHGQLGRLASAQLQLLNDVAAQDDAHAGAGHNYHT